MGCGNSKAVAVQPLSDSKKKGWAEKSKDKTIKDDGTITPRDGSAVSKTTMDSGLGQEDTPTINPVPAGQPRTPRGSMPPNMLGGVIQQNNSGVMRTNDALMIRQQSSDILDELRQQGIIQTEPKFVRSGEAFDVMVASADRPLGKPPARLAKLKPKEEQSNITLQDIENKIKAAEERRKVKEEELKQRLRTASERPATGMSHYRFKTEDERYSPDGNKIETANSSQNKTYPESQKQIDKERATVTFAEPQKESKQHLEDEGGMGYEDELESDSTFNKTVYKTSDETDDF
ncbi:stathmin domain-containing protein 1 [Protopterus annectens]|uniref:stathmin domain-containing protein 1 n=1 Tax=Protopterus annectens TaxID=7888 RepID=UPI001CF99CDC|nr:stathmin domain-containing protein 1 [Protopterus annectens]